MYRAVLHCRLPAARAAAATGAETARQAPLFASRRTLKDTKILLLGRNMSEGIFVSTAGAVLTSKAELDEHYKSDFHRCVCGN